MNSAMSRYTSIQLKFSILTLFLYKALKEKHYKGILTYLLSLLLYFLPLDL